MNGLTLSEWLEREERTATWLARKMGINQGYVSAMRLGSRTPHPQLAAKISAFTAGYPSGPVSILSLLYPDGLPEGARP